MFQETSEFELSLKTVEIQCPYCWESFEVVIDPSVEQQSYIEDCYVCCRPIEFHVTALETGEVLVDAVRENE